MMSFPPGLRPAKAAASRRTTYVTIKTIAALCRLSQQLQRTLQPCQTPVFPVFSAGVSYLQHLRQESTRLYEGGLAGSRERYVVECKERMQCVCT